MLYLCFINVLFNFAGVPQPLVLGPPEPDASLLQLLGGRQLLTLAAAALHVPALHLTQLEATEQLLPPTSSSLASAMHQPLVTGM